VIWVAWRRHRLMLAVVLGLMGALAVWMAFVAHTFHVAAVLDLENRCPVTPYSTQRNLCSGDETQAGIIQWLLLALPCVAGVLLGGPLVAGELHHSTNRLAWTQGISRNRWYITKWLLVAVPLAAATALFQLVANWWRPNVNCVFGVGVVEGLGVGFGRLEPSSFAVTGIVPVAYALFALALGVALGAVVRRTPWAIAGTLVLYAGVALMMVLLIRPNLLPQTFVPVTASSSTGVFGSTQVLQSGSADTNEPWLITFGFRYQPGYPVPGGAPSADAVGADCTTTTTGPSIENVTSYVTCLSDHHVQQGAFYQPARHYWPLQWIEGGIYLLASVVLFGVGLWSVRRWRA